MKLLKSTLLAIQIGITVGIILVMVRGGNPWGSILFYWNVVLVRNALDCFDETDDNSPNGEMLQGTLPKNPGSIARPNT